MSLVLILRPILPYFFCFFFFLVFCLFRVAPTAYGGSQARGSNQSCSHRPTPQLQQHQILEPRREPLLYFQKCLGLVVTEDGHEFSDTPPVETGDLCLLLFHLGSVTNQYSRAEMTPCQFLDSGLRKLAASGCCIIAQQ